MTTGRINQVTIFTRLPPKRELARNTLQPMNLDSRASRRSLLTELLNGATATSERRNSATEQNQVSPSKVCLSS